MNICPASKNIPAKLTAKKLWFLTSDLTILNVSPFSGTFSFLTSVTLSLLSLYATTNKTATKTATTAIPIMTGVYWTIFLVSPPITSSLVHTNVMAKIGILPKAAPIERKTDNLFLSLTSVVTTLANEP